MKANKKQTRCPDCGSSDLRFAHKKEQPEHQVVLRRYITCESCGCVFQNTQWWSNPLLHALYGLAGCAVFGYKAFTSGGIPGRLFHGILAFCGFLIAWQGFILLFCRERGFERRKNA